MKLGFCGLGLMGAPMVERLLAAGHEVQVWNRSVEKTRPLAKLGAKVMDTPAQAATGVDGVLMCLFDSAAVEAVVFGPQGVAKAPGLKWIVDQPSSRAQHFHCFRHMLYFRRYRYHTCHLGYWSDARTLRRSDRPSISGHVRQHFGVGSG